MRALPAAHARAVDALGERLMHEVQPLRQFLEPALVAGALLLALVGGALDALGEIVDAGAHFAPVGLAARQPALLGAAGFARLARKHFQALGEAGDLLLHAIERRQALQRRGDARAQRLRLLASVQEVAAFGAIAAEIVDLGLERLHPRDHAVEIGGGADIGEGAAHIGREALDRREQGLAQAFVARAFDQGAEVAHGEVERGHLAARRHVLQRAAHRRDLPPQRLDFIGAGAAHGNPLDQRAGAVVHARAQGPHGGFQPGDGAARIGFGKAAAEVGELPVQRLEMRNGVERTFGGAGHDLAGGIDAAGEIAHRRFDAGHRAARGDVGEGAADAGKLRVQGLEIRERVEMPFAGAGHDLARGLDAVGQFAHGAFNARDSAARGDLAQAKRNVRKPAVQLLRIGVAARLGFRGALHRGAGRFGRRAGGVDAFGEIAHGAFERRHRAARGHVAKGTDQAGDLAAQARHVLERVGGLRRGEDVDARRKVAQRLLDHGRGAVAPALLPGKVAPHVLDAGGHRLDPALQAVDAAILARRRPGLREVVEFSREGVDLLFAGL